MVDWEFLLQKEGDRSWLPLDTPDVEILEGRYRIIARSNKTDTDIAIHIAHLATEEHPPKRRVQTRTGHTNSDGLIVVIPFTHLQPGQWELECTATEADPTWRYAVQLHVLVGDCHPEDWEPEWTHPTATTLTSSVEAIAASSPQTSVDASTPTNPFLNAPLERLLQLTEQMSDDLVNDLVRDLNLPTSAQPQPTPSVSAESITTTPERHITPTLVLPAHATCRLELADMALVTQPNQPLAIVGKVTVTLPTPPKTANAENGSTLAEPVPDPWEAEVSTLNEATDQILEAVELTLRDPQTLQVLVSDRVALTGTEFPAAFSFIATLPDKLATHLVIGEVLLLGAPANAPDQSRVITTQPFTVTVNLGELTNHLTRLSKVIAKQTAADERDDLPSRLSAQIAKDNLVDLSFLQLGTPFAAKAGQTLSQTGDRAEEATLELSFLEAEPPVEAEPVKPKSFSLAGQPLPPQLYTPAADTPKKRSLELPGFVLRKPPSAEGEQLAPTPTAETPTPDSLLEAPLDPDPDLEQSAPVGSDAPIEDVAEQPLAPPVETTPETKSEVSEPAAINLPSPDHMAFQALRLQDRFFDRLSSLATSSQAAQPAIPQTDNPFGAIAEEAALLSGEPDYLSQEIVVDDDEPLPTRSTTQTATETQTNPLLLSEDEPVPTPELWIGPNELIAGNTINLRVRIPNLQPKIYIKLWITDCETRSLLDPPRWLTDLIPNGQGDLEVVAPLRVPFGSLDIRFEAIAVEMATQRESHKASLERAVLPPDLPPLSLDELGI